MTPTEYARDTTDPAGMPAFDKSYQVVVAYADGRYEWSQEQIDRYREAKKHIYRISVTGADPRKASFVDCERFDVDPAGAARYVRARNAVQPDGGVYCSRLTVPAVVDELGDTPAWLWCADWTGEPHVPVLELPPHIRLCMVQYASTPRWDLSAVYSAAWLRGEPNGKAGA